MQIKPLLAAAVAVGCLATSAHPASAQVWGSVSTGFRIGHVPIGLTVGTGPAYYPPPPVYAVPPPPIYPRYYPAPVYPPPPVFINGYYRYPHWFGRPGWYRGRYYHHGYWRR